MPNINDKRSMQSTVIGWQHRDVRRRLAFPAFRPTHGTFDYFSQRFPATAMYRETLAPAQIYSEASRPKYTDMLKTALVKLPGDHTLEVRWRLSDEKPAFSLQFLQMYLTRKYGPVAAIYQRAINSCLVVFKEPQSAFVMSRDPHKGKPFVEQQPSLESLFSSPTLSFRGVGGTVGSESALRSAGTLLSRFKPRHRRPGLTDGLEA
ncbi:hypothetical protein PoB_003839200 [Plakobranchus ocellatus]|uniref:Uncharacterized protein n=1 Tax=Plakobranchus ocellatus TaxID=259542 RepID=A0AAV4AX76_9GAST|nr:hypothetical protein PoB_003839200 [Plakobranchus ocellatus]